MAPFSSTRRRSGDARHRDLPLYSPRPRSRRCRISGRRILLYIFLITFIVFYFPFRPLTHWSHAVTKKTPIDDDWDWDDEKLSYDQHFAARISLGHKRGIRRAGGGKSAKRGEDIWGRKVDLETRVEESRWSGIVQPEGAKELELVYDEETGQFYNVEVEAGDLQSSR
ncbi:hypothetical protein FRB94_010325 [Tulasnella sp. JGI-2019a]|nr:hypothetical protein FRB94_010325 [Tulasnella sp. JGI-2019a]KAG9021948.1 hypothetical protein FRB95_001092 [Tulasnella sp. JGI-2019a]